MQVYVDFEIEIDGGERGDEILRFRVAPTALKLMDPRHFLDNLLRDATQDSYNLHFLSFTLHNP